jgi:hypothetical protein
MITNWRRKLHYTTKNNKAVIFFVIIGILSLFLFALTDSGTHINSLALDLGVGLTLLLPVYLVFEPAIRQIIKNIPIEIKDELLFTDFLSDLETIQRRNATIYIMNYWSSIIACKKMIQIWGYMKDLYEL